MAGPNILGGGVNILGMANSLLDNGRAISARNGGVGMSARSRAMLEGFYNNGTALFNQLYAKTENAEIANQTTILALRAKNKSLISETQYPDAVRQDVVASSSTNGTRVDTEA
jgi:hypothetical protein